MPFYEVLVEGYYIGQEGAVGNTVELTRDQARPFVEDGRLTPTGAPVIPPLRLPEVAAVFENGVVAGTFVPLGATLYATFPVGGVDRRPSITWFMDDEPVGNGIAHTVSRVGELSFSALDGAGQEVPSPVFLAVEPVTLDDLTLSATTISEDAAEGALVGAIDGHTAGSTLALDDNADGRFALNGTSLVVGATPLDYEAAASHAVTIRETLAHATNSPHVTLLTISVSDVVETQPVTLAELTLSAATVSEDAVEGTVVGSIQGRTDGSTLSLADDAGGRFALSGTNVIVGLAGLDYEAATSHSITIRETLAGATNTPRDTVATIAVTDVDETPAVELAALSLSASTVSEDATSGTVVGAVQGKTAGSTLTLTGDAGGLFALDGGNIVTAGSLDYEAATSHQIAVRETLADASDSPRDTALTISVTDVDETVPEPAYGFTETFDGDLSAWTFHSYDDTAATTRTETPTVGSIVGGRLRLTAASGAFYPDATIALSGLTPGTSYTLSLDHAAATSTGFSAYVLNTAALGSGTVGSVSGVTTIGTQTFTFEAAQATHYLLIATDLNTAGQYNEFDNLTIEVSEWVTAADGAPEYQGTVLTPSTATGYSTLFEPAPSGYTITGAA